jgi:hypothetical protein
MELDGALPLASAMPESSTCRPTTRPKTTSPAAAAPAPNPNSLDWGWPMACSPPRLPWSSKSSPFAARLHKNARRKTKHVPAPPASPTTLSRCATISERMRACAKKGKFTIGPHLGAVWRFVSVGGSAQSGRAGRRHGVAPNERREVEKKGPSESSRRVGSRNVDVDEPLEANAVRGSVFPPPVAKHCGRHRGRHGCDGPAGHAEDHRCSGRRPCRYRLALGFGENLTPRIAHAHRVRTDRGERKAG